jgi:hypothetical protein
MNEIKNDPKPPFPFSMIEGMMPMYPMIALMGWMFVLIAVLVGLYVFSPAQGAFFADAKAIREGAAAGSAFVQANVDRHVIEAWLPQFKFFGLGLGLMSITMALGTIAKKLRYMGKVIASHLPVALRPDTPPIPKQVRLFQVSTMMGLMILVGVLIYGILLATGAVPAYWSNAIICDLNPAQVDSALLGQLGLLASYAKWLNPLRMLGMTFLFSGITVALGVIIGVLRTQSQMLVNFYNKAS